MLKLGSAASFVPEMPSISSLNWVPSMQCPMSSAVGRSMLSARVLGGSIIEYGKEMFLYYLNCFANVPNHLRIEFLSTVSPRMSNSLFSSVFYPAAWKMIGVFHQHVKMSGSVAKKFEKQVT